MKIQYTSFEKLWKIILEKTFKEKNLGVYIDPLLTFEEHIKETIKVKQHVSPHYEVYNIQNKRNHDSIAKISNTSNFRVCKRSMVPFTKERHKCIGTNSEEIHKMYNWYERDVI